MPYLQDNVSDIMWAILWKYSRCKEMMTLYDKGKLNTSVSAIYFASIVKLHPSLFSKKVRDRVNKLKIHGSIVIYEFITYYEKMLLIISHLDASIFVMSLSRWERNEFQYLTNEQISNLYHRFGLTYKPVPYREIKKEKERGIYYLTSGHYLEYILWRRKYGKAKITCTQLEKEYPFCKYLLYEENGNIFSYNLAGRNYIENMTTNKVVVSLCRSKLEIPAFHPDIESTYRLDRNTFVRNRLPTNEE